MNCISTCNFYTSWIPLIILGLLFARSNAQSSDTTRNLLGYTFTGNYNKTNESTGSILNNQINLSHRSSAVDYNLMIKYLYGVQQRQITNNDLTTLFDINKYSDWPGIYSWGLVSYGSIFSLSINKQFQSGVGLAYDVLKSKWITLNLSDGLLYDYSDVNLENGIRNLSQTPRNSFRARLILSFNTLCFIKSTYLLQNSLEYKNDIIQKIETELTLKIRGHLSARIQMQYNKMTKTNRETLFATFGLNYSHHF